MEIDLDTISRGQWEVLEITCYNHMRGCMLYCSLYQLLHLLSALWVRVLSEGRDGRVNKKHFTSGV